MDRQKDAGEEAAGVREERPGVVRVPGWEALGWLRAGFSTRAGGGSTVYGGRTLNLGWTREDDPEQVRDNRRRFAEEIAGGATELVGLRQVHSDRVWAVERGGDGGLGAVREGEPGGEERLVGMDGRPLLEGDGLVTEAAGVLLGVGVADCVPVLIADTKRRAVAALHAGWRGTLARIAERGVAALAARYGSAAGDLIAAVGPAIGPCCYAVGDEVRTDFEREFGYAGELLRAEAGGGERVCLDLWVANRRQLIDAGVAPGKIWVAGECTACTRVGGERRYFSHRGEGGFAGRGLGAIGVVEESGETTG